jgi:hypothetical protein
MAKIRRNAALNMIPSLVRIGDYPLAQVLSKCKFYTMIHRLLSFVVLAAVFIGCGDPPPDYRSQDIGNAIWRTNSDMLIFAEKKNFASAGIFEYKLYKANGSGEIGDLLADEITTEIVPPIYLSPDGNTAVFVVGGLLIKQDLNSGTRRQMTTNVTKLYAVSPDLKYAVVTHAFLGHPVKTVSLLDISGAIARSVNEWQATGLTIDQGYWINGDKIALTFDTTNNREFFVSILDTAGNVLKSHFGISTPAASSDYDPVSNSLFAKQLNGALVKVDAVTGARLTIVDDYSNLDVRGNTLAFIATQQGKQKIFLRNLTTGAEKVVAEDALRYPLLSPDLNRLAYVKQTGASFTELRVIDIQVP